MDTGTEKSEEDWNQHYLNGHTPWDHGTAAPAIQEVLASEGFPTQARVLVPGCGFGHDVRAFARAGHSACGLDLSTRAIDDARELIGKSDETGQIDLIAGDLFDPDLPGSNQYDVVWEHTCFCAIPRERRTDYASAVQRLLKPGGLLIGLFYINTGAHEGDGPPHDVDRQELQQLLGSGFSLEWEKAPAQSYASRAGCEWLMSWRVRP